MILAICGLLMKVSIIRNIQKLLDMFLGMEEATIEDLAFGVWPSREVDQVDLRVCLSGASYAAAEKDKRRMALKI